MKQFSAGLASLTSILPNVTGDDLIRSLVPPREFASARFETYIVDSNFPSQKAAVDACQAFLVAGRKFGAKKVLPPGIYLDGGFGVGKTHLLASIWHGFKGKKLFAAFLDLTAITGYLGFAETSKRLSKYQLICIDEFELDDPGDTMIMSRLLKELSAAGVKFAATSNTPPNALGEGRFASADFKREIAGLGEKFEIITVDGEDFRHRDINAHSELFTKNELVEMLGGVTGAVMDDFDQLLLHLSKLHPTKFRTLLEGVGALAVTGTRKFTDQVPALRWVSLVDRLYEAQIPLRAHGEVSLTDLFPEEMLTGGYRKKYLRAVSRIASLSERPLAS